MKTALDRFKLYFEDLPGGEDLDARIKAFNARERSRIKHNLKDTVLSIVTKITPTFKFHIPTSKQGKSRSDR